MNRLIVADGTEAEIEQVMKKIKNNTLSVFKGDYVGVNPLDEKDVWDLRTEFIENEKSSAPCFCYILRDVITVK